MNDRQYGKYDELFSLLFLKLSFLPYFHPPSPAEALAKAGFVPHFNVHYPYEVGPRRSKPPNSSYNIFVVSCQQRSEELLINEVGNFCFFLQITN